jgi:hypothetical protein
MVVISGDVMPDLRDYEQLKNDPEFLIRLDEHLCIKFNLAADDKRKRIHVITEYYRRRIASDLDAIRRSE